MQIPQHVANYSVFRDGRRLLGLADVTLMNVANLTATFKGAGVPGEIDVPVQCHFQAMSVVLNWHTVTDDATFLFWQDGINLEIWAAHQYHETTENRIIHHGWRYILGLLPKGLNFGTLEVGAVAGASTEHEVMDMRVLFNDREMFVLDKGNFVNRVDGHDFGAPIRQLIGLN
jgi:uncharacterized protein